MILLTEKERQQLRESALHMSRQEFDKFTPSDKRAHWNHLDKVIQSIMLTHPEAFTDQAIKELKQDLKNKNSYARH
jgi:hypothetical protein